MGMIDDEVRVLLSHAQELSVRADKGVACWTAFLSPGQQRDVLEMLRSIGKAENVRLHGGFCGAERACVLFFPDYALDMCDPSLEGTAAVRELLALCGEEDPVTTLHIRGSGFCNLTHRDYLGSLLSLGLEREVLGDIEMPDAHGAYLFCRSHIATYIAENLERVGGDKVTVKAVSTDEQFASFRRVQPMSDTVASTRLDCVVASLANLSRDAAQQLIRDGRVELEYRVEERVDRTVPYPAAISIRGVGKFRVLDMGTQTKKGRLRMSAEKFI